MSIREVEDVVELSVSALDRAANALPEMDCRSLYASLYEFCDRHDTCFTRFRNMDLLLKHRFVYLVPLSVHPLYHKLRDVFDAYAADYTTEMIWLDQSDSSVTTGHKGIGSSYLSSLMLEDSLRDDERMMYVEAGSSLWAALVEVGYFNGREAIAPERFAPFELAESVSEYAASIGEGWLAAEWYGVLGSVEIDGMSLRKVKSNKSIAKIRKLAQPFGSQIRNMENLIRNGYAEDAVIDWWLELLKAEKSSLSIDEALEFFRNPPDIGEYEEYASTGYEHLRKNVFADAFVAIQNELTPPVDELAILLHHRSPWVALFAAILLEKHAKLLFLSKSAADISCGLLDFLDSLDASDSKLLKYIDSQDLNIRQHLVEVLAKGGVKGVPRVLEHARQKILAGRAIGVEWDIAFFSTGRCQSGLWRGLVGLQIEALKSSPSTYCTGLQYSYLVWYISNDKLPFGTPELSEMISLEGKTLCELWFSSSPFVSKVKYFVEFLEKEHPVVAALLSHAWAERFIPWLEVLPESDPDLFYKLQKQLGELPAGWFGHNFIDYMHLSDAENIRVAHLIERLALT